MVRYNISVQILSAAQQPVFLEIVGKAWYKYLQMGYFHLKNV